MKTWKVHQLRDALIDMTTRQPKTAECEVLLIDAIEYDHYGAGLTSVEPDVELGVVALRSDRSEPTADTLEMTRRG